MDINILSYNYVSELQTEIQSIINNFSGSQNNLKFVVPSRKDKNWFFANTLNLWTWDEIYDDVCEFSGSTRKKVLSPPDHFLILDSILKEEFVNFPDKIQELPGLTRTGFLEIISSDLRELMNEGVEPSKLEHNPDSSNPSEFLLPEVYENYLRYLDNYDLLDSAQICSETLNEIRRNLSWGNDFTVIFTGFMSFNHSQLNLVQALNDRCRKVLILKPEANLENFHDADIQILGFSKNVKKSSGRIIEIPVAEPSFEPEVTARNLALWSQNKFDEKFTSFDDVGLLISNGTQAAFSEALERYKIPYDFVEGIAINQTLPGKILMSIRGLMLRNFPAYETGMLLTQPCFAGIKFPVMRAFRSGVTGLENWEKFLSDFCEENEIFNRALMSIKAIKKFCENLSRLNTPKNIIKAFYEFLTAENLWLNAENKIYDFPELDETFRTTASAIQTVGEKVLALEELLPDLGSVKDKKFKGDEAFDFLESWCKNSYTRAPLQITNAVRIFVERSPVLSHFPIWIMTNVTQKTWSANINSSPLLGNSEREKLAVNKTFLPMTHEKAMQKEALFRRMILTGEKLTIISRPELDSEGRPLSESTFMQRFFDDMAEWKHEKIESEGIKILLGGDNFVFPEIDPDPEKNISRFTPKVFSKANFVGASEINELLGCSFLWWQKRQARLYEQNSEILSPAEWGNMLHKFWECVWKRYSFQLTQGKDFIQIAREEWEKLLQAEDENYQNFAKPVKDFRLKRRLNGIKFRVDRLVLMQASIIDKFYSEGYEHEKILLEEDAHLKLRVNDITFLGQCDRIEIFRTPTREKIAFIVDYKTGKGENYENSMKISGYKWNADNVEKFSHGLQLSVYAALFNNSDTDIKLSGVYILGLEDGKISGSFTEDSLKFFSDYKSEKFNSKITERINEGNYAMECAAEILKSGEFEPEYNSDLCKFCNIKSICRKSEFKGEILSDNENENGYSE